ncbi:hypothetical protein K6I69_004833 [Salmonella enterica subsp. diarizonae serovar 48:i:z]|nr:hypothetical protein [Salmonella enterica subsp. diarizonae serovar 48:i:z]
MPGNNREESDTIYGEMSVSTDVLEDFHCLLDTYSDNLQEKLLLLAVVTHSLMSGQNIERFESLLPCGHRVQFINTGGYDLPFVPGDPPQFLH